MADGRWIDSHASAESEHDAGHWFWNLEGFDKKTDELVHEAALAGAHKEILPFLSEVLTFRSDDPYALLFYEIEGQELDRLATRFQIEVDAADLNYFVGARASA